MTKLSRDLCLLQILVLSLDNSAVMATKAPVAYAPSQRPSSQTFSVHIDKIQEYCNSLNEEEIIEACSNPRSKRPGKELHCRNVIRLKEDVVIKHGYGVREEEAHNIQKAFEIVNQNIVRTPRLFRYFRRAHYGYILMEYIDGEVAEGANPSVVLKAMTTILQHFKSITGCKPGPLGGGWSRGLMWEDQEAHFHGSVTKMEQWYNRRLSCGTLSFKNEPLVLCHLDLSLRNIILNHSKPPAVVDWTSAGFYPLSFELYMLFMQHNLGGGDLFKRLLEERIDCHAMRQKLELISEAWSNAKKNHL